MTVHEMREKAILALPSDPHDLIFWVVYNEDMAAGIEEDFIRLRGAQYVHENIHITTREYLQSDATIIYYDPELFNHMGNGTN